MVDISATIIAGLIALDIGYDIGTRNIQVRKSVPLILTVSVVVSVIVVFSYFQVPNIPVEYPVALIAFFGIFSMFAWLGLLLGYIVSALEPKESRRRK